MSQRYWEHSSSSVAGPSTWPADVYGPPPLTFPTSENVRDEPIRRPPPPHILSPSVPHASVSRPLPSVPQPSSEAVLITAQNAYVVEYINKLSHWKTSGILPPRLVGLDRPRISKKQRMSEACWVASVANVNAVLDRDTPDLSKVGCMCVLAVAALSLLDSPTSVACPALWADGVYNQTAEVVQKVCCECSFVLSPCLASPDTHFRRPRAMPHPTPGLLDGPPANEVLLQEERQAVHAEGRAEAGASQGGEAEGCGRACTGTPTGASRGRRQAPARAEGLICHGRAVEVEREGEGQAEGSEDADSQPSAPKPVTRQAKREYITAIVPPANVISPPADVDALPKTLARPLRRVVRRV
ncbi:hypothetical protein B0H21DRAFT_122843 [Amylocystis lapponica]|nr:hypothetical protein B0H21DRAFT_122843 [Amylocystis lapponica]